MKKAILDTSFIIAAVQKKIDFFEEIEGMGLHIMIPSQAIKEMEGLNSILALKILEKNRFELVSIQGKDADSAIIKFSRENPAAIVATLDKALQKKIMNRKLVIRGRKKLEII